MFDLVKPFKIIADSGTTGILLLTEILYMIITRTISNIKPDQEKFYDKENLFLPIDNSIMKLLNVLYAFDLSFNLINTFQFEEKSVKIWVFTIVEPSLIFVDKEALGFLM